MDKLRVAHVLPWPSLGGVEEGTIRLVRAVRPEGVESIAYCLPEAIQLHQAFGAAGCDVAVYNAVQPSYRRPVPWVRSAWQLARDLRRRKVQLLHCADLLSVYYTGLAGRLAGIPVVSHVRCRFDAISSRDQTFLWAVNYWLFVSQKTWDEFGFSVPPVKGQVVYDGIDAPRVNVQQARSEVRSELEIADNAPVIGMVARVAEAKDFPTLIRAAVRVVARHPKARFLIVGDHTTQPQYREHFAFVQSMLKQVGLTESFTFTGHRADVARLIAAMDLYVLSSHGEGLPLSLLEGMIQRKPVLATEVGGVPEIVLHDRTGLLHRHEDDLTLAEQMIVLLENPARAEVLASAGEAFVRERFGTDRFANEMAGVYRRLIKPL